MNVETIEKLLKANDEMGTLLNIIGENSGEHINDDLWDDVFHLDSKIYTSLVYEAIKAHMNRYLYLWGNAEKNPDMELSKDNCSELINEIEALKKLFANEWLFGANKVETQPKQDESKDEYTLKLEAIVDHMNRFLSVYSVLKNNPNMDEYDKANGHGELGAEIADLEDLFNQLQ